MTAPRGGSPIAALATLVLIVAFAASSGTAADTLAIDVRHRWVALTARVPHLALDAQTASAPPGNPVGMNVFLEQEVEPDKRQLSLELLRAAHVGWIRQELPWEQIEPNAKGEYVDRKFDDESTWAKFDDIVERANRLGLSVVLRLDTSPRWALPPGAVDGLGPPVLYEHYWDFVEQAARRYRGRVFAYQVWNEPNLRNEWGGRPPDPKAYAELLKGAAARIRAADPNARVVMAGLAPTLTENEAALNELVYLRRLYEEGVKGSFDILAVHAYGLRGGPDDPRMDSTDVTFSRPQLVRQIMLNFDDAATPVWATEVGWNVNPPEFEEQDYGRVTPTLQARYTARAFERMHEQWPWLQVAYVWFWKRPDESERAKAWFWFRVADPDFTLQPVYYALRDAQAVGPLSTE